MNYAEAVQLCSNDLITIKSTGELVKVLATYMEDTINPIIYIERDDGVRLKRTEIRNIEDLNAL